MRRQLYKRQYCIGMITQDIGSTRPEDTTPMLTHPVCSLVDIEGRNTISAGNRV